MLSVLTRIVPPGGKPYCEPYCGSAALLFARSPAPIEVLNDMDERIVNVFRVMQEPRLAARLQRRLLYTPYARAEYIRACQIMRDGTDDPVLRAWAVLVGWNQGLNGYPELREYGWGRSVATASSGCADTVNRWVMRLCHINWFIDRLRFVQIEQRDGIECIRAYDNPDAVFYVDPPYVLDTRISRRLYVHEPQAGYDTQLIDALLSIRGHAVLSGYRYDLIHSRLEEAGWVRIDVDRACSLAVRGRGTELQGTGALRKKCPRTESVWICPRTAARMRDAIETVRGLVTQCQ